jgi:hypothetical protein
MTVSKVPKNADLSAEEHKGGAGAPIAVSLRCKSEKEDSPQMSLRKLFAWMRERRRRAAQQRIEEEGAEISKRLRELLSVPTPTQEVARPSTNAGSENDPACV